MIQCDIISDRMPDVALGRSSWSSEERAHIDTCADCQAEWRLVQSASRLGASLPPLPTPEVMAAGVLGRLAGERTAARARRRAWLAAGVAAAAAVIIAVRLSRSPSTTPLPMVPAPAPVAVAPVNTMDQTVSLPELEGLPDGELQAILGSLDEPTSAPSELDGSGLDNLDDHELEDVLGAWEG